MGLGQRGVQGAVQLPDHQACHWCGCTATCAWPSLTTKHAIGVAVQQPALGQAHTVPGASGCGPDVGGARGGGGGGGGVQVLAWGGVLRISVEHSRGDVQLHKVMTGDESLS